MIYSIYIDFDIDKGWIWNSYVMDPGILTRIGSGLGISLRVGFGSVSGVNSTRIISYPDPLIWCSSTKRSKRLLTILTRMRKKSWPNACKCADIKLSRFKQYFYKKKIQIVQQYNLSYDLEYFLMQSRNVY